MLRPRASLPALILLVTVVAGCGAGVMPAVRSDAERLELARRMSERGQCSSAIELLRVYVANNPGGAEVDDAIYLTGVCYLRTKDWVAASAEFERLLRDYPESDSAASASFRLGEALFGQARPLDFDQEYTVKALEQWQSYLRFHPGHWLNAEAQKKVVKTRRRLANKLLDTGRLYLQLKLPEPARTYFRRVADEYGDTGLLGEAWVGLARADALDGKRGAAIERLRQVETRFSGQPIAARAAQERARLER